MDSLTQIVLGAAVGEILLGKKLGNKAILIGAIGGTLPDLDVIYNLFDDSPAAHLRVHRGYSHSMFTHLVASFPLAWMSFKISDKVRSFGRWYLFWFLALFTHALLDCCTTYGTRLLLPFTNYQVAFNNISVVDPIYTLPFLISLIVAMFFRRESRARRRLVLFGMVFSSVYLLVTLGLKFQSHLLFRDSLAENGYSYQELNATPTILNSILWSAQAFDDDSVRFAEYSFLKPKEPIRWTSYPRNSQLLNGMVNRDVETALWFSDGVWFATDKGDGTVNLYSCKFGRIDFNSEDPDKAFFFYWNIYRKDGKVYCDQLGRQRTDGDMREAFEMLFDRIGL
jgi:inner membrane protein